MERVQELVSTDVPDLSKTFKNGVLKTCDEVRGKNSRRNQRDMRWRWGNEEVKEIIA